MSRALYCLLAVISAAEARADFVALQTRQELLLQSLEKVQPAVVSVSDGQGFGTGVVVSADGIVLTACHVIDGPRDYHRRIRRRVHVVFPDGMRVACERLGRNRYSDAAMLKITDPPPDGGEFPHVKLGQSSKLFRGDWCFALGHPGGRRDDRPAVVRFGRILSVGDQTLVSDNAIVLGDSGGPLFDLHGRLIGIHSMITRIIVENRHVAIDVWHRDWDRLREGKMWGELHVSDNDLGSSSFLGLGLTWKHYRAQVNRVVADGPADRAGLRSGDALISIDGRRFADRLGLSALLGQLEEQQDIRVGVHRRNRDREFHLMTGTFPDAAELEMETEEDLLFQRDYLNQISAERYVGPDEKRAPAILTEYFEATRSTQGGVVQIQDEGGNVCLGTVMTTDGYILTKASEVLRTSSPFCVLPDGSVSSFRRVATDETWDLMLIHVEADEFTSVEWSAEPVNLGCLLITPDGQGRPMRPGVVGVSVRPLETSSQGFLGVRLERSAYRANQVKIVALLPGGAAKRDGLREGDIVLSLNGKDVRDVNDMIDRVRSFAPNTTVDVRILRGDLVHTVKVTLSPRFVTDDRDAPLARDRRSGDRETYVSTHNSGFPEALQHDTDLYPDQCGGPLLDISGMAVGLNIARAARIISYALPASAVQRVFQQLRSREEQHKARLTGN